MSKSKIIISSVLMLLIIGLFGYRVLYLEEEYFNNVVIESDSNLYKLDGNKYNVNGKVESSLTVNINSKSNKKYLKIENSDYYISYKDIKKTTHKLETDDLLLWEDSIKSNKLYLDGKLAIEFDEEITVPIYRKEDEIYIVYFLNQLFEVKKESATIVESKEENSSLAQSISILYYPKLEDSCSSDYCMTKEVLDTQLNYLKENSYNILTIEQYKDWLKGHTVLKAKSVLLVSNKNSYEEYSSIIKEHDFHFINGYQPTTSTSNSTSLPRYLVSHNTSTEEYQKMIDGVDLSSNYSNTSVATKVPVLNYHFFYNQIAEQCNESICLDINNFEQQLQYLNNNGYYTVSMEEFLLWKKGKIELPEKSVLLTVDDGAMGTGLHNGNHLIPMLEKHHIKATLFLITGWWGISNYQSDYLDVEAHTHDMHTRLACGAEMLCSTEEQVLADLALSISVTGSTKAFCFPFYLYDNQAISRVKQAGFELAFIGGNKPVTREMDNYHLTRYPIYKTTSINEFIKMIES